MALWTKKKLTRIFPAKLEKVPPFVLLILQFNICVSLAITLLDCWYWNLLSAYYVAPFAKHRRWISYKLETYRAIWICLSLFNKMKENFPLLFSFPLWFFVHLWFKGLVIVWLDFEQAGSWILWKTYNASDEGKIRFIFWERDDPRWKDIVQTQRFSKLYNNYQGLKN